MGAPHVLTTKSRMAAAGTSVEHFALFANISLANMFAK